MPRHTPHSAALRQAIILLERPVVGRDGHRGRDRLPEVLSLRATLVGGAPVCCTVDVAAVRRASGVADPTWSDLQSAWQTLATSIQRKIRSGDLVAGAHGESTVHIAHGDVLETSPREACGR